MRIEKLFFTGGAVSGGPALSLSPSPITIFIGPNNGGKSTALREIYHSMLGAVRIDKKVIDTAPLETMEPAQILAMLEAVIHQPSPDQPDQYPVGRRGSSQLLSSGMVQQMRASPEQEHIRQMLRMWVLPHYAMNLDGQTRLTLANAGGAQKLASRPLSTVAAIFKDDELRRRISKVIHDAFGAYLVIDPTNLGTLGYALSTVQPTPELERSFTEDAIAFFKDCEPLETASDGTKAFVGVVTEVMAGEADILFIDEPEAFLHPGLAYALGREVALNVGAGKQLFAATHSPQFLLGCLEAGVAVNVVRLSRREGANTAHLLDSEVLSNMMSEPLLRSSNVISGLFYNAVVVVEGNSDKAFYEEVNLRLNHKGQGIKHPLFVNANGKQTAPEIAAALRNAGVPTALILDLDWLKEDGAVQAKYFEGIGLPVSSRLSVANARGQTRRDLEAISKNYKREGGIDLLASDAMAAAEDFLDGMNKYGLFTVRRGEVEAWLADLRIHRSKQGWLERIFSAMGSRRDDPEYVQPSSGDVWDFLDSVSIWLSDPNRRGMLRT